MALLSINGLTVEFPFKTGWYPVVESVSFSIHHGEIVSLVGESGSGKSVTALACLGLLPDNARVRGRVLYLSEELPISTCRGRGHDKTGTHIGMIFQEPWGSLNPVKTVRATIAEVYKNKTGATRRETETKIRGVLKACGIQHPDSVLDKYPWELSGGLAQRVSIACALILEPSLLVADEPTTALDVTTQAQILKLLKEIASGHRRAVMLITHNLEAARLLGGKIVVIYAGRIVEQGPAKQVLETPGHPYTRALLEATPYFALEQGREKLGQLYGTIPTPEQRSKVCLFAPRCRYATDHCWQTPTATVCINNGWRVSCHHPLRID